MTQSNGWGQSLQALMISLVDLGRLRRGRIYAQLDFLTSLSVSPGLLSATVLEQNSDGSAADQTAYQVAIRVQQLSESNWNQLVVGLTNRPSVVLDLTSQGSPGLLKLTEDLSIGLLPQSSDLQFSCTCADSSLVCQHAVGLLYRLSSLIDKDILVLLELRGLPRADFYQRLSQTPLKQILSNLLIPTESEIEFVDFYYTPVTQVSSIALSSVSDLRFFWEGSRDFKKMDVPLAPPSVSALLVKSQGDFPAFWTQSTSFIKAMEALYDYVRTENQDDLDW